MAEHNLLESVSRNHELKMNIRHSILSALEKAGISARHLIGLLGSSADHSDEDFGDRIAPSGGVYNYRTGNLDDGTDAIGWYEDS